VKPRNALFAIVPLALLLLPVGVFWVDESVAEGEVPRNVRVGEVDLSGLSYDDAILAMQAYEHELRTTPASFAVNATTFQMQPSAIELDVDEETAVEAAMAQRRDGGTLSRFWSWLTGFSTPIALPLPATVDDDAVDDHLFAWETAAIPNPAFEGSVSVAEGEVITQYPKAGERLDGDTSARLMYDTVTTRERATTTLRVVESVPVITDSDVDAAAAQVRRAVDSDVTLSNDEIDFVFTFVAANIARAIGTEVHEDPAEIIVLLDEDVIAEILDPARSDFELPPRNATYSVNTSNDSVSIIHSRYGTKLDAPGVTSSLLAAALGSGTGPFPVADADPPSFSTEDAEAYGPLHLEAKFSTNTPGTNRVTNIHIIADAVDGVVTLPGQTFSLNEEAGRRTEEKGYLEDCAIVAGAILCEGHPANIGGGVSQFATTLYNAGFFACYEDVEHRPHSLYFERYPEAREATLGFPNPDVKIRNDSEAPFIIKTAYNSSVVTVRIYGNNGGRTCDAELGERGNIKEFETVYVADVDNEYGLAPGQERRTVSGKNGWTVTSTRVITYADGTVVRQPFWWKYAVLNEEITVHPCMVSGEARNCPIQVPGLAGQTYGDAAATLAGLGFVVIRSDTAVTDPASHDIVISVSPGPGTWVGVGGSVTLTVGVYEDPGGGDGDGGDGDGGEEGGGEEGGDGG
jgi:vancomycin resistance protein YoaR